MRYGRSVEKGFMPVMSVDTEAEAKSLLTLACPLNLQGEYIARELAREQTMDNLFAFGDRLIKLYEEYVVPNKGRINE